ncbi:MAG: hypothetical protein ACRENG_03785 [bacterium]
MKHVIRIALVFVLFLPVRSLAQKAYAIDRGSMIVGGSAGFSSFGGDFRGKDRLTMISFNPNWLFFFAPHVAIGGTINFTSLSASGETDTFFGVGPSIMYFFGGAQSRTYPFMSGSFIYGRDNDDFTKIDLRLAGGAAVMIAKNVAITTGAFYVIESVKYEDTKKSINGNTFGVEIGITAFVF